MNDGSGTGAGVTTGAVEAVRQGLLEQACLFEDPGAYAAGVEDALAAVAAVAATCARRVRETTAA